MTVWRRSLSSVLALAVALAGPWSFPLTAGAVDGAPRCVARWPSPTWHLKLPRGAAVDATGNVFIADTENNRVVKYAADGSLVKRWGSAGTGTGFFDRPEGIAVGPDGSVYVADTGNNRIQQFDSNGTFVRTWGRAGGPSGTGTGDGELWTPIGVAVDASGRVFVADSHNCRIQRFSSQGAFQVKWGLPGSEPGHFGEPTGVAVDSYGRVYVIDRGWDQVQRFDGNGVFQLRWGGNDNEPGYFREPSGICVDAEGSVYVADTSNNRVQRFDADGVFLNLRGGSGTDDGKLKLPAAVAAGGCVGEVYVYVVDTYNNRLQQFSAGGALLAVCGSSGTSHGRFNGATGVAVGPDGNVYASDWDNDRLQKFGSDGTHLLSFGAGISPAMRRPAGMGISSDGWLYVADSFRNRVLKYSIGGPIQSVFGHADEAGTGDGWFDSPMGVAVAPDGTVYVADTDNHRIQRFASNTDYISKWGAYGTGAGSFKSPNDVAVAPNGDVYVADTLNHRIQQFDALGNPIRQWGAVGVSAGKFSSPKGVGVAPSGDVYVADTDNHRIQRFTSTGQFLEAWGSEGAEAGQFSKPEKVAVDANGYVYVADTGNHRIQKFAPPLSIVIEGVADGGAYRSAPLEWTVRWLGEVSTRSLRLDAHAIEASGSSSHGEVLEQGWHTLEASSTDVWGAATAKSVSFCLDTSAPVTSVRSPQAAYSDRAVVVFEASDALSGVVKTRYRVDGAIAYSEGSTATVEGLGDHYVEYWSEDRAGNVETPAKRHDFTITDAGAPLVSTNWVASYEDTATIRITADDRGGAGVAKTCWSLDDAPAVEVTGSVADARTGLPGTHRLEYWAVDTAGNASTTQTVTFSVRVGSTTAIVVPTPVGSPSSVTLTGRVYCARRGTGVQGCTVVFERLSGGRYVLAGQGVTDANGRASLSLRPVRGAKYRARFAGTASHRASVSTPRLMWIRRR